jgi:glutaconate CoA-transferase subunit B
VGPYGQPKVRLPGGGGAPEIASHCRETFITMSMSKRTFVAALPFVTSFGHGEGGDHRQRLGLTTAGPTRVITDLCVLEPDPVTKELVVTALHPGVTVDDVVAACGWPLRLVDRPVTTEPPTELELRTLRDLQERTRVAHGG